MLRRGRPGATAVHGALTVGSGWALRSSALSCGSGAHCCFFLCGFSPVLTGAVLLCEIQHLPSSVVRPDMIRSFLMCAVFSAYVRFKHRIYEGHGEDGARYILKFLDYERLVANPRLFAQVCPLQLNPILKIL